MSITIRDCFNLPSLRIATLVAGKGGLDKHVDSVSVLEWINLERLQTEFFIQNELLISSFYNLKDSISDQVLAIRKLHSSGEIGLVLYYVGRILPEVHPDLIDVCNELDFPLMIMPESNQRYSEAIMEITELIYKDRAKSTNSINRVIEALSSVPTHFRSYETLLRVISDQLKISLAIKNELNNGWIFGTWPTGLVFQMGKMIKNYEAHKRDEYYISSISSINISKWQSSFLYVILEKNQELRKGIEHELIKIIELTIKMWDLKLSENLDLNYLISILNNDLNQNSQVLKHPTFSLEEKVNFYIFAFKNNDYGDNIYNLNKELNDKFLNTKKGHIKGIIENQILLLAQGEIVETIEELIEYILKECPDIIICSFTGTSTKQLVNKAYSTYKNYIEYAKKVFPMKNLFKKSDFDLIKESLQIIKLGDEKVSECIRCLLPIMDEKNQELINTLETYYLDTSSSITDTAEILYLHSNSIKYRLQKVKKLTNIDFDSITQVFELFRALILLRLQKLN